MDKIVYREAEKMCTRGEFVMRHTYWREDLEKAYPECSHFMFSYKNNNWRMSNDGIVMVVGDFDHITDGIDKRKIAPNVVEDLIAMDDKLGDKLWKHNALKSVATLHSGIARFANTVETECAKVGCQRKMIEYLNEYYEELSVFKDMVEKGHIGLPDEEGRY